MQTTLGTLVLLLCTTTAWCILAGLDDKLAHQGRRSQWFALLFGPFGAVMRWLLSGYNSRLPRPLHWFPIGTFAANMSACIIDFVLQVGQSKRMASKGMVVGNDTVEDKHSSNKQSQPSLWLSSDSETGFPLCCARCFPNQTFNHAHL